MKNTITAKDAIIFWYASTMLALALVISTASTRTDDPFSFLLRHHPKVSTSMITTGPEHVERVLKHSLVFSPKYARKVLPDLNKNLTKRRGWTKSVSTPGEYVVYERGGLGLSYMSHRVYRSLIWPNGTKLLPTEKGGCVVEYYQLKKLKK
jgi:hypothetical protein